MSGPLHRADIEAGLRDVADQLQRDGGAQVSIIIVGGSFMTLHGLRGSTADVDSVSQLDDRLLAAVRRVAAQRGWPEQWLNDRARPWRTAGLHISSCLLVLDHPALAVYTPGYAVMFLMKLNAARGPQDYADARALWPHTDFADAEAVVRAFYDAYPNERPDPDLTDFVRTFQAPPTP